MIKEQPRSGGHISISNVDGRAECVTLTYTIKNLANLKQIKQTIREMDELHEQTSITDVSIPDFDTEDEQFNLKYKIKACNDESLARSIKAKLDKYVGETGGQTTLDEIGKE